jgi:hypothetical protein
MNRKERKERRDENPRITGDLTIPFFVIFALSAVNFSPL